MDMRPELTETTSLVAVNGDALKVMGKAIFKIQLGNLALQRELIVAGIEDECLLGLDILQDCQFGPAVIDLNESRILMNGFEIQCSKSESEDLYLQSTHKEWKNNSRDDH
uniref:Uncharacterized protein n=1 Tax=Magallana gigas TaxID=29159 RepID=K1QX32_MAGGI